MDQFLGELRYAFRSLRNAPGTATIAVVALALGIGLTSVMFSIVYGALHRGLPFEDAKRIMHLERSVPTEGIESIGVSIHDYVYWGERQRSFEQLAGFRMGTVNIRGSERPERYEGAFVTASTFEVLGVEPVLGRTFTPEETQPGAPMTVVLGYNAWQEKFGGRDVLGEVVTVNSEQGEIIGVMPEGFEFPLEEEVWVPNRLDPIQLERGTGFTMQVFGKLREGVSIDQASVEFASIADELAEQFPETNTGIVPVVKPYTEEYMGGEETGILYAMLTTVVLVLIIACANVANLLLARASTRMRDLAIRTAMGASRLRVVRQVLAEAIVLAVAGATGGLAIAWVGITLFDRAVQPTSPPFWLVFKLDAPIIAFVMVASVLAALVSGIIPALKASRTDVNAILKDESRGSSSLHIGRLARTLVVAEIAMSMALLFSSGLMLRSSTAVRNIDPGFRTEEVLSARLGVFPENYPDRESRQRFWDELHLRLEAIPGVRSATFASAVPGTGAYGTSVAIDGQVYDEGVDLPSMRYSLATPEYDDVMGIEMLQGRWFTDLDGEASAPVAVVTESFALRHFGSQSPIGRFVTPQVTTAAQAGVPVAREIVGLVADQWMSGLGDPDQEPDEGLFMPLAQFDANFLTILVHTDGDPLQHATSVRDAVEAVDAETPIYFVRTVKQAIDENLWFYNVFGGLFMAFGAAALFLSSVGLYGVMAFSVSQRTQEMGVRMALGAAGAEVRRLVLRQGVGQIVLGSALGAGLGLLLARGLTLLLYDVPTWDPTTLTGVFVLLLGTGIAASLVPAARATRVDPVVALRAD